MTDNRAIIDGKLYVRMVSDGPMMALTAQELTTRVLNFEKRLEEKERYISALEGSVDVLKTKLNHANELANYWHEKYAALKLQESQNERA